MIKGNVNIKKVKGKMKIFKLKEVSVHSVHCSSTGEVQIRYRLLRVELIVAPSEDAHLSIAYLCRRGRRSRMEGSGATNN